MSKQKRLGHRSGAQRSRVLRGVVFASLSVVVLGLAVYWLFPAWFRPALPPLAGTVIDVAADMSGFDQDVIRIRTGESVTVRLTSLDSTMHTDGGGKHQWAVDELGVSVIAPALGSNTVTFTADKPGTYTFYCDICCGGRANPSMQGTLIVES
ncbi:MAG: cupredoxin domain-containing protein [Anaerolineales bacterium]|nr:cupredoxin domain-containing protein [Anaerolineales bacterium]